MSAERILAFAEFRLDPVSGSWASGSGRAASRSIEADSSPIGPVTYGRSSSRQARQYSGPPPGWKCQRQRALIRFLLR